MKTLMMSSVAAILMAGTALAAGQFSPLDTNQNGVLDQNEFEAALEDGNTFSAFDNNNDGVISEDEYNQGVKNDDWFAAWDADKDGFLEPGEFDPRFARLGTQSLAINSGANVGANTQYRATRGMDPSVAFNDWDENGDGKLEPDEFRTGMGGLDYDRNIASWDTDDNGEISQNEYIQGMWNEFDADENGQLSADEVPNWFASAVRSGAEVGTSGTE